MLDIIIVNIKHRGYNIEITIILISIAITVGPLFMVINQKRVISYTCDKSIIYLASEIAYTPEKWKEIELKIDYKNPKKIHIPLIVTWKGMVSQPLTSLFSIGTIWYGIIFIILFIIFSIDKLSLGLNTYGILNNILIMSFGLCWFLYHFRSFASDITESSIKSDVALSFLLKMGWEKINIDIIDTLKEEIKVDFDMYKKNSDIANFILFLFMSSLILYSKINDIVPENITFELLLIFGSISISKWLYESYRNKIIYIALNSIIGLKKNIQLNQKYVEHTNKASYNNK